MTPITFHKLRELDPVAAEALLENIAADEVGASDMTIMLTPDGFFACHDQRGQVYEWDSSDVEWYYMGDD
jgi:hypothetical protein